MEKNNKFSFWKKPWIKWLTLVVGLMQIPLIIMKIIDYKAVINSNIYSEGKLEEYAANQSFDIFCSVLICISFLAVFIFGMAVKKKKTARLFEVILLFADVVSLIVGLILWHTVLNLLPLWIAVTVFAGIVLIYSVYRYVQEPLEK